MKRGNRGYYYFLEQEEQETTKQKTKIPFAESQINELCELYGYPFEDLFSSAISINPQIVNEPFRKSFKTYPFTFFSLQELEQRTVLTYWGVNPITASYNNSYLNMDYQNGFVDTSNHHSISLYGQFFGVDGEKLVSGGLTENYIYTKSTTQCCIIYRFYRKGLAYRYSVVNPRPTSAILNNHHDFVIRINKESDSELSVVHVAPDDTGEFRENVKNIKGDFHTDNFEKIFETNQVLYIIDIKSKQTIIANKETHQIETCEYDFEIENIFRRFDSLIIVTSKFEIWSLTFDEKGWKPVWKSLNVKMDIPEYETTCSVMNSRQYVYLDNSFRYFANGKFYELSLSTKKTTELEDITKQLEDCMYFCWNATDKIIYYVINNNLFFLGSKCKEHSLEVTAEGVDPSVMDILPCEDYIYFYYYDDSTKNFNLTTINHSPNQEGYYTRDAEVILIDSYKFKEQIDINTLDQLVVAGSNVIFVPLKEGNILNCPEFMVSQNWACFLSLPSNDVDLTMGYEEKLLSRDDKEAGELQKQIKTVDDEMTKLKNEIRMSLNRMRENEKMLKEKIDKGESVEGWKYEKSPAKLLEIAAMNKKLKKVLLKNLEQNKNRFKKSRGKNEEFDDKIFYG